MELTAAHLRYLLAIYEVSQTHLDICSRSIAEKLNVTKPSVVRIMNLLMDRGMIVGIQINELNAGCICCSLVGDFRAALQQVVEQYHPDRIVIEPSGVGKLSDVTRAVEGVAEHLDVQLNSFVTVADVNKVKMYMKNFGEFYDDQISHASCILLSRTQTASEEKIAAAVAQRDGQRHGYALHRHLFL